MVRAEVRERVVRKARLRMDFILIVGGWWWWLFFE